MRYSFADCVLDIERRELRRADQVLPLRPKVFQVLTYLIEQRHRVVTKEELFEHCWPGVVVGDASLNSCLKEIRRAIGDSGSAQKYLRTLHGYGYHFVAVIRENVVPDTTPDEPVAQPPGGGREFKQVSVLACRITNAGELAARADAEAIDVGMRQFFGTANGVLERYGGVITEHLSDGFTALFGAPRAFEDHGRRAAAAAVELRDLLSEQGEPDFALSIGLHTGGVIVGKLDDSEQLYTAAGETTQMTMRIRDSAGRSILASGEMFNLIGRDFETRPVAALNDLADIVEVVRLSWLHGGVPLRKRATRNLFVGREDELAIIRKRLALAEEGLGQVVCISGEPGIGKSRLLMEVRSRFKSLPATYLHANCLAYRQTSPYFSLLQLLRQACGVRETDPDQEVRERLTRIARNAGIDSKGFEVLSTLFDPVRSGGDGREQPDIAQLFSLVSQLILHSGAGQLLVITLEDLHWLDASTEQWLQSFVPRITAAAVLLLVTFRPGYQSAWLGRTNVSQLALPRLNDADSVTLIVALETTASTPEVRRRIVNSAQGNPFFLEELTFNLVEGDSGDEIVPRTVQAVLAARIDQLAAEDKELLQLAAVIGTPVSHALLDSVSWSRDINASIARLELAELLYAAPTAYDLCYFFKHALTRDVAYQSLLASTRRKHHRAIADAYDRHFPDLAAAHPELVAHHFTEAGNAAKAMTLWQRAGELAVRRSANPEAVTHFEKALVAGEALPDTDDLKRQQLDIYIKLGPPTMASKAFASPAVGKAYQKASQLCNEIGDRESQLIVHWGMWLHVAHRGNIDEARPLAKQIMQLANDIGDDAMMLQAHHAVWTNEIWHGDLETCYESAMAGTRLYDPERHQSHKYLFGGHDPGVCARGTAGIAAWFLGKPQQAIELTASGAMLAEKLDHTYSRIITFHDYMETEALRGNPGVSAHYGQLAVEACTEQSVPDYLAVGHIFAGYGIALTQDLESGMAQMKHGLETCEALGAARNMPPYLMFFAELCLSPRHCMEGIAAIDKALAITAATGTIRWLPELKRARGELVLLQSADMLPTAEALFGEAAGLASEQGCRSFELRAATSLARIMKDRGDIKNAAAILGPVYDTFTEGFDTRDLRIATQLMDELR